VESLLGIFLFSVCSMQFSKCLAEIKSVWKMTANLNRFNARQIVILLLTIFQISLIYVAITKRTRDKVLYTIFLWSFFMYSLSISIFLIHHENRAVLRIYIFFRILLDAMELCRLHDSYISKHNQLRRLQL